MPEISRFYGIIIRMFVRDHFPPHFHAEYSGNEAMISIATGEIIEGVMPRRALRLIQDWVELHKEELEKDFEILSQGKPDWKPIKPLE